MLRSLILATCTVAALGVAQAQESHQNDALMVLCPEVGDPAPAFSAVTRDAIAVDIADISGPGGAVVVFSRSLDWCPYCKTQAIDLKSVANELDEAGWPLSLITYDPTEKLAEFGDENAINYTLLSDTDSAMIDAFGLRNTDVPSGGRFDGIPHPAIVYIGSDGMIKGVQKEDGYKDRPPAEAVLQLVKLLNQDLPAKAYE